MALSNPVVLDELDDASDSLTYAFTPVTLTAGRLYLVWVDTGLVSLSAAPTSIDDDGPVLTWTKVEDQVSPNGNIDGSLWWAVCDATTAGVTLTLTYAAAQSNVLAKLIEIDGADQTTPIPAGQTGSAALGQADVTASLPNPPAADSITLCFVAYNAGSAQDLTADQGTTLGLNQTVTSPTNQEWASYINPGVQTMGFTGTNNSNKVVLIVEVAAASVSGTPHTESPPVADFDLEGIAPALTTAESVIAPVADFDQDGVAPVVRAAVTVPAPVADFDQDGVAPTVGASATVSAPVGDLDLEPLPPSVVVTAGATIPVTVAEFDLDGTAPVVRTAQPVTVAVPVGDLDLEGIAPSVGVATPVTISAGPADFDLDGTAPAVTAALTPVVVVPTVDFTVDTFEPTMPGGVTIAVGMVDFDIDLFAPFPGTLVEFVAPIVDFDLEPIAPQVSVRPAAPHTETVPTADFDVDTFDVGVGAYQPVTISAGPADFDLDEIPPVVGVGEKIPAGPADFDLDGLAPVVGTAVGVPVDVADFDLDEIPPVVTAFGEVKVDVTVDVGPTRVDSMALAASRNGSASVQASRTSDSVGPTRQNRLGVTVEQTRRDR